ncbi:MFS transporter, partial [Acidianus sp. RZ1]|uniref:MFS transporter n=1 Tax=Acidianus sp. RZ1 TaxID=1540082 RepID=UPI0014928E82
MNLSTDFYRFWLSRNFLRLSDLMFYIYFTWIIIDKYDSVFLVSIIPSLSLLGYFIIAIPEGYLLDRLNRTYVIFGSGLLSIFVYVILIFNSSLLAIYFVDLLASVLSLMSTDAFYAYVKDTINSEDLPKAISYTTIGRASSEIIGSLLGGISAMFFPSYFPWIIISISCASLITAIPGKSNRKTTATTYGYSSIWKVIRAIMPLLFLLTTLNGLFVSIQVLSSGLFHIILGSTALLYTFFILGFSVGTLIGGIIARKLGDTLINSV